MGWVVDGSDGRNWIFVRVRRGEIEAAGCDGKARMGVGRRRIGNGGRGVLMMVMLTVVIPLRNVGHEEPHRGRRRRGWGRCGRRGYGEEVLWREIGRGRGGGGTRRNGRLIGSGHGAEVVERVGLEVGRGAGVGVRGLHDGGGGGMGGECIVGCSLFGFDLHREYSRWGRGVEARESGSDCGCPSLEAAI